MKEENTYYDGKDGLNLPGSLRVNPFMVPESYFEQLSSTVLSQVRLQHLADPEKTDFSVPKAYFSQLADHIQLHLKMEQYKDNAPAAWDVPKGYFEDLSQNIIAQTRIENVDKQEELDVPEGYFENLSERIQTKIFEEKLKEEIPVDGYTAPADYAETLSHKIMAKTVGNKKQETKVRKLNFHVWIRYAAAACIAMVLGITSYQVMNKNTQANIVESHLASISEDEIINYLSALHDSHDILYIMDCIDHDHSHDSDGICTHVKEDDIEDYLNYML